MFIELKALIKETFLVNGVISVTYPFATAYIPLLA